MLQQNVVMYCKAKFVFFIYWFENQSTAVECSASIVCVGTSILTLATAFCFKKQISRSYLGEGGKAAQASREC